MHDEEISELLIQAMAFLEYLTEHDGEQSEDERAEDIKMLWAAHSHIQRAWGLHSHPNEAQELSSAAIEQLWKWKEHARQVNALYDTKN